MPTSARIQTSAVSVGGHLEYSILVNNRGEHYKIKVVHYVPGTEYPAHYHDHIDTNPLGLPNLTSTPTQRRFKEFLATDRVLRSEARVVIPVRLPPKLWGLSLYTTLVSSTTSDKDHEEALTTRRKGLQKYVTHFFALYDGSCMFASRPDPTPPDSNLANRTQTGIWMPSYTWTMM